MSVYVCMHVFMYVCMYEPDTSLFRFLFENMALKHQR